MVFATLQKKTRIKTDHYSQISTQCNANNSLINNKLVQRLPEFWGLIHKNYNAPGTALL